jgi:NAD(P)-dependent dehydrogenase (short-subunit alcohol dehydrogenase family)
MGSPRFSRQAVLVTGAGSGIGQASALLFARDGALVAVLDRDPERANETTEKIHGEGGDALALVADVRSELEVAAAVEKTVAAFGRLDILHNHAGILHEHDASILEIEESVIDEVLTINIKGMMLAGKHAARAMIPFGRGAIVNTASDLSLIALPGICSYVTSKTAIPGLTRAMAADLAPHGIRVNAIAPGFTYTRMTQGLAGNAEMFEAMRKTYLIPRLGQPDDIAHAVLFLASDEAAFITGAILPVDGGHTVQ